MMNQKNLRRKKAKKRERRKNLFSMKKTPGNHHQETGTILLTKLSVNNLIKTNVYKFMFDVLRLILKTKKGVSTYWVHNAQFCWSKDKQCLEFCFSNAQIQINFSKNYCIYYIQTPNSCNGRNCSSLRDIDIAKYPNRGVSILFRHWPKRNKQNLLWGNVKTQLPK